MKEVKTERKIYDLSYEAVDGTRFTCKEECEKYEQSAKAVLWAKFKKLVVKEGTEYSMFTVGCDDSTVYAIKMETETDADVLKQLWVMDHSYLATTERYPKYQEEAFTKIDTAYQEMDILFVGEDCEGQTYIIDTRANIIEDLQNIDKKQDDSKG